MEKFGLLNLLKAIDGLNAAAKEQNASSSAPPPPSQNTSASATDSDSVIQTREVPNIMYETLVRHEAVSNRLRNRIKTTTKSGGMH